MLLSDSAIDLRRWNESLHSPPGVEEERESMFGVDDNAGVGPCAPEEGSDVRGRAQPLDITALLNFVQTDHLPHSVIMDCSSANPATREHATWLARGVHVVSGGRGGAGCTDDNVCRCQRLMVPHPCHSRKNAFRVFASGLGQEGGRLTMLNGQLNKL